MAKEGPTTISFQTNRNKEWIMKLSEEGIKFNLEAYPEYKPCDFAKEIIDLLENNFGVTFNEISNYKDFCLPEKEINEQF